MLEDEKPPPEEMDEKHLISRRARERALAMVEEVKNNGGAGMTIEEGDDDDDVAAIARRKELEEEEEEEKAKERMRRDVLARRRSLEMDRGTPMYWVGADARNGLSLDDDDDPFDVNAQPWRGRLSPIDLAEDEAFPGEDEDGVVQESGAVTRRGEEATSGGWRGQGSKRDESGK